MPKCSLQLPQVCVWSILEQQNGHVQILAWVNLNYYAHLNALVHCIQESNLKYQKKMNSVYTEHSQLLHIHSGDWEILVWSLLYAVRMELLTVCTDLIQVLQ